MSDEIDRLYEAECAFVDRVKRGDKEAIDSTSLIEHIRAENERLRAALRPFAEAADGFDSTRIKNPEEWFVHHGIVSDTEAKGAITVGDLRRARAELEETNE